MPTLSLNTTPILSYFVIISYRLLEISIHLCFFSLLPGNVIHRLQTRSPPLRIVRLKFLDFQEERFCFLIPIFHLRDFSIVFSFLQIFSFTDCFIDAISCITATYTGIVISIRKSRIYLRTLLKERKGFLEFLLTKQYYSF